jgi:hypothetical protein
VFVEEPQIGIGRYTADYASFPISHLRYKKEPDNISEGEGDEKEIYGINPASNNREKAAGCFQL